MKILFSLGAIGSLAIHGAWAQPSRLEIQNAVEKALPALQQSGPVFVKKSGCVSCHHQTLPAQVTAMAKERGYRYDQKIQTEQIQAILGIVRPAAEIVLEGSNVVPQIPATGSHILFALSAHHYPLDQTVVALVTAVAMQQKSDGSWPGWSPRPPISGGDIRETALAVHALNLYKPAGRTKEFDARIERASRWLASAKPRDVEESIVLLDGLVWSKARRADVERVARMVVASQRPDGGWAQLTTRESDAYATGEALVVLHRAGVISTSDEVYKRGADYLLHSREEDGSWHIKTRAYPFQPLIDSGYPHGRDQWISAAGTSYALMALMLADSVRPSTEAAGSYSEANGGMK